MPVPRLDQNPVGSAPLPGVRVPTDVPARVFGSPEQADLGPVQQQVTELIQREREKADTTALLDADNKLATLQTDLHVQASQLRGKDAMGATQGVSEQWQKGVAAISGGLTTDQQRRAFANRVGARWGTLYEAVETHAAGEAQQYATQTASDALKNRLSHATEFYQQPAAIAQSIGETKAIISDFGKHQGWSPETLTAKTEDAVSQIHGAVIDRMLANEQDLAASQYYQTHKDEIGGDDKTKIERALEEGSVRGESQRQADAIVAKAKGMPDALDAVRKIADPKVRDATDQRVRQFFTEQKTAMEERRQANYNAATNIVEQTRDVNKVPPAVWSTFTVGERGELRNYAEKLIKGEPIQTDWTRYYDLMNLASSDATKQEFLKTNLLLDRARLSDTEFKQLTDIQTSLRKDDGKVAQQLGGYRTINEVVEGALKEAGITQRTMRPDDVKRAALFRRSVDLQIQTLEAQTGKKATDADAQRVVDNLLVKGRVAGTESFFGLFGPDQRTVFERQPGDKLVLKAGDIPPVERARIETALRQNRLPITDAAVLRLYVRKISSIPTIAPPP